MLAGLGHDPLVGGDDQHGDVDAARTGKHVLYELLVARHVDYAGRYASRQLKVGEAQLDGYAALLLFGKAVGINARKGLYKAGLAVVDVTGRSDYNVVHFATPHMVLRASEIYLSSPSSSVRTSNMTLSFTMRQIILCPFLSFSSSAAAESPAASTQTARVSMNTEGTEPPPTWLFSSMTPASFFR